MPFNNAPILFVEPLKDVGQQLSLNLNDILRPINEADFEIYVGSQKFFHKCLSQYYATVHRGGAESAEEAQRKYQKAFLLFLSAESPRSPRLYGE